MKTLQARAKRAAVALSIVILVTPLQAQTMHRGERTDDATGIHRNMTKLRPITCGLNQAPVGNTCVDIAVTPPQPTCGAGYVLSGGGCVSIASANRSWVSYFLGQTRPVLLDGVIDGYATINWNGTISFSLTAPRWQFPPFWTPLTGDVPVGPGFVHVGWSGSCAVYDVTASPYFSQSDRLNGSRPSDWYAYGSFGIDCPSIGL